MLFSGFSALESYLISFWSHCVFTHWDFMFMKPNCNGLISATYFSANFCDAFELVNILVNKPVFVAQFCKFRIFTAFNVMKDYVL